MANLKQAKKNPAFCAGFFCFESATYPWRNIPTAVLFQWITKVGLFETGQKFF
jgi:hypothetical protein